MQTSVRSDTARRHARKYANKNPLHRLALGNFFRRIADILRDLEPRRTLDFGCGEGLFLERIHEQGYVFASYVGVDTREEAVAEARKRHPQHEFLAQDIFRWDRAPSSFDLVIASQVLEHLRDPEPVLRRLTELSSRRLLLTVPLEPWFQILNLLRGRDLARLGNHPEHVNRWGLRAFSALVSKFVSIRSAEISFPFIIVVGET
jgi:trans-aconitate methyltransferase